MKKRNTCQRQAASCTSIERDFDMDSIVERADGAKQGQSGVSDWIK
jgi:hypothetical protein